MSMIAAFLSQGLNSEDVFRGVLSTVVYATSLAVADAIGQQGPVITAACGGIAIILTVALTKAPGFMKARSEQKKVDASVQSKEQKDLLERVYEMQDRERAVWEQRVSKQAERIDKLESENVILREAKHSAMGAVQPLTYHIYELKMLLKDAGIDAPEIILPNLGTITSKEDAKMEKLTGTETP